MAADLDVRIQQRVTKGDEAFLPRDRARLLRLLRDRLQRLRRSDPPVLQARNALGHSLLQRQQMTGELRIARHRLRLDQRLISPFLHFARLTGALKIALHLREVASRRLGGRMRPSSPDALFPDECELAMLLDAEDIPGTRLEKILSFNSIEADKAAPQLAVERASRLKGGNDSDELQVIFLVDRADQGPF
jgi:hypothetical protein